MFRDKGPITNLGFGLNARDFPQSEEEEKKPNPNSGLVARAFEDRPILKFISSTAATLGGAYLSSRLLSKGGIKLAQKAQTSADMGSPLGQSVVSIFTKARKAFDELEGLNRFIADDVDPYTRLVYTRPDGSVIKPSINRLAGQGYVSDGARWMTDSEFRSLNSGRAPVAYWSYRDQLQTGISRSARSLGVMLPSLYLTQRAITDPVFGNEENRAKVNWYNPVDVVTDFVKQSTINAATMLLPEKAAGASLKRFRDLSNVPYMDFPIGVTDRQRKTANTFADLKTILSSFGQDAEKIVRQTTRISSSASYAFNKAYEASEQSKGGGLLFSLHRARRGIQAARQSSQNSSQGKLSAALQDAKSYVLGFQDNQGNYIPGLLDSIPAFQGIGAGVRRFPSAFNSAKNAYDVVSQSITYNTALQNVSGSPTEAATQLNSAILSLRKGHAGRFSSFVDDLIQSKSHIHNDGFFFQWKADAYQKAVRSSLVRSGVDEKEAARFVGGLKVSQLPSARRRENISERITFGIKPIVAETDDDFFSQLTSRAKKDFSGQADSFTQENIKRAFTEADNLFYNRDFLRNINATASLAYRKAQEDIMLPQANRLLRPQKAIFQDFIGDINEEQRSYLSRRIAQNLGIKIVNQNNVYVSDRSVARQLANRGINVEDTGQLKTYLIDNKMMTSPSSVGGFNIFGLKQISVDEAFDKGIFSHFNPEKTTEATRVFAELALKDPVSRTIGYSGLTGVYETASGRIVDTTKLTQGIKSSLNFVTEQFKIPFVNFNPLQMIGVGGPKGINPAEEIKFIAGASRQPFVPVGTEAPNVYAWTKKRSGIFGDVGELFGVSSQPQGDISVSQVPGLFKRFSSIETDLYSRAARLASGTEQRRDSEIASQNLTGFSRFKERFRSAFDIAEEQPSSIFRSAGRFRQRKVDLQNPTVMANILSGEYDTKTSAGVLRLKTDGSQLSVVNQSDREIFDHRQILEAMDSFRRTTSIYATPLRTMRAQEEVLGLQKFDVGGNLKYVSEMSDDELTQVIPAIKAQYTRVRASMIQSGQSSAPLTRAYTVVAKLAEQTENIATNQISHRSPTITTRQDKLRNAMHKLMVQMHSRSEVAAGRATNPVNVAIDIERSLVELRRSGQITADQLAEARVAALETVFDIAAFSTYVPTAQRGTNIGNTLNFLLESGQQNQGFSEAMRGLLSPIRTQAISNVGATGFGNQITSVVRPALKRRFGFAPYELSDNSVNPLGNEGTTFVPTFGSLLDRASSGQVGFGKIAANITGFNSYSSPETFSSASVPAIHLSDRLNRYLGAFGIGLDSDKYSSPMSFFAGGIVGKRVLPIFAGGAALMSADRTVGGMLNDPDMNGERVYSPYFTTKAARGIVEAHALAAGVIPGGMGYEEKRDQLLEGEVAIRQGRFWPLGVTPFEGSKILYYRPSYYRRLQSGGTYTSDAFGSPLERLAYGYDFSPLRPFDPYRFEREHYFDRPYPVTGEYFSGPFGPITPLLNATVGRVLKPQVRMHEQEVATALSQYVPAGYAGAFNPVGLLGSGQVNLNLSSPISEGQPASRYGGSPGFGSSQISPQISTSILGGSQISSYNAALAGSSGQLQTARNISFNTIHAYNTSYLAPSQYGPPPIPGYIPPKIVPAGASISQNSLNYQISELGYRTQEMAGIYGFSFASIREGFGLGTKDISPETTVLQSASKAYGSGRSFWDLNLGGLGDVPGSSAGLEVSEIVRRFIPKERTDIDFLNPIRNTMGQRYSFLPGSDYFINFQTGDPFSKVQEGELRLPGIAYERLNPSLRNYEDPITQLNILGDVAPYSRQYRALDRQLSIGSVDPAQRGELIRIREQVEQTTRKKQFDEYVYKYSSAEELGMGNVQKSLRGFGEFIAHRDTYINTKFLNKTTAQEDWERRHVYGSTFPEWQNPVESFIEPIYNRSTQRNPITAGIVGATVGTLFARSPRAAALSGFIGASTTSTYSAFRNTQEAITGERFIPTERKKQLALEEYVDILSYVKSTSLANEAARQRRYGSSKSV